MINFGPKAAQQDKDLMSYFHQTVQVRETFVTKTNIHGFLFVTRSGCGKTALVTWLKNSILEREIIYLSPSQFSLICDDDNLSLENYKNIISAELSLGIIDEFYKKISDEVLKKKCKKLVKNNWLQEIGDYFKHSFSGISILGNGLRLSPQERSEYLDFIKRTDKIRRAEDLLIEITKYLDILVVVDNPEFLVAKGMNEISDDNSKRIGAFLSVLSNLHHKNIQVAAFTKEYIIQSVKKSYQDFNHFSDKITGLEWKKEDLIQMLENRIIVRLNKKWNDVFNFSKAEFIDTILPYLVNGPRDLIDICNFAGRHIDLISKDLLEEEFPRLMNDKWDEFEVQYKKQWPFFHVVAKQIIEILKEKKKTVFTKNDFKEILTAELQSSTSDLYNYRNKADWIDSLKWKLADFLELIFLVGLIGYEIKNENHHVWEGRFDDEFKKSNDCFVTPLFLN